VQETLLPINTPVKIVSMPKSASSSPLDLEDIDSARRMVSDLQGIVNFFKIGISLQTANGRR